MGYSHLFPSSSTADSQISLVNELARLPFTYRLIASVATLAPESIFECPYIVSVPTEEVASAVYCQSLVNMDSDKVIISTLCAWHLRWIEN